MASISLMKIAEKMKLENLTPEINLKGIKVTLPDINRPALPMAGYFEHFEATRLQVIGFVEYSYVKRMSEKEEKEMLEKLLDYPIPGIIFCRELHPDELFRQIAIAYFIIEKKNAVNTKKTVRKNMLLRTVCIFGQFCKLEFITPK